VKINTDRARQNLVGIFTPNKNVRSPVEKFGSHHFDGIQIFQHPNRERDCIFGDPDPRELRLLHTSSFLTDCKCTHLDLNSASASASCISWPINVSVALTFVCLFSRRIVFSSRSFFGAIWKLVFIAARVFDSGT